MLHDTKEELMGTRPCYGIFRPLAVGCRLALDVADYLIVLDLLVTHPNHLSKGAGRLLIEWGLDKADPRRARGIRRGIDDGYTTPADTASRL